MVSCTWPATGARCTRCRELRHNYRSLQVNFYFFCHSLPGGRVIVWRAISHLLHPGNCTNVDSDDHQEATG
jgi:hypothetical protein